MPFYFCHFHCQTLKKKWFSFLRTPINYLLLNLALADILFAVFNVPHIFNKLSHIQHPDGVTGTVLCKLVTDGQIASVGAVASFVTLAAIAFERYYAVVYPLGDKNKFTINNLKVSLNDVVFISSA